MAKSKRVWDSKKRTVWQDKKQVWEVDGDLKVNGKGWEEADSSKFNVYGNTWTEPATPLVAYDNSWEEIEVPTPTPTPTPTPVPIESLALGNIYVTEIPVGSTVNYPITISPEGATGTIVSVIVDGDGNAISTAIEEVQGVLNLEVTGVSDALVDIQVKDTETSVESNTLSLTIGDGGIKNINFAGWSDETNHGYINLESGESGYSGTLSFNLGDSGLDDSDLTLTVSLEEGLEGTASYTITASESPDYPYDLNITYANAEGESIATDQAIGRYTITAVLGDDVDPTEIGYVDFVGPSGA